jgi:hypothetical protein
VVAAGDEAILLTVKHKTKSDNSLIAQLENCKEIEGMNDSEKSELYSVQALTSLTPEIRNLQNIYNTMKSNSFLG